MRKERERLDEIIRLLDTVDRKLDRVEVALVVGIRARRVP